MLYGKINENSDACIQEVPEESFQDISEDEHQVVQDVTITTEKEVSLNQLVKSEISTPIETKQNNKYHRQRSIEMTIPEQNLGSDFNPITSKETSGKNSLTNEDPKTNPFEVDQAFIQKCSSPSNRHIFIKSGDNSLRNSQILRNTAMTSSFSSKFWQSQMQNAHAQEELNCCTKNYDLCRNSLQSLQQRDEIQILLQKIYHLENENSILKNSNRYSLETTNISPPTYNKKENQNPSSKSKSSNPASKNLDSMSKKLSDLKSKALHPL
ncbi:unnamed protein product [Moneuplotes crassus]|uniref:Uncharacterized protein n=1 Tax=Euplotes crassus TaxID=5936 RepID=A0AAD2D730_EUPCR|nr:unnamed protein product [Moneuplotes crassus]